MKDFWQKIKFPVISFISGYVLMAVELTSTRVVAPFIGLSVYTWTSVIGITLLGLSIGNYFGGFLADKTRAKKALIYCLSFAALFTALIPTLAKFVPNLVFLSAPLVVKILIISLMLFLLPAIFMGTVYPLLLKLYSLTLEALGKKAGWLSASWSLGSILGTFLTGFYFIGFLGSANALYVLAISLVVSVFLISDVSFIRKFPVIILLLGALGAFLIIRDADDSRPNQSNKKFIDESNYYKIQVVNGDHPLWGKVRALFLDFDSHSFESLENRRLDSYTEIYPIFKIFKEKISSVYTIGGGAYTLAKGIAKEYPDSKIIVSEIDPEVTQTAEKFFGLKNYPQIKTVFEDGRVYLINNNSQKYDLIFGDAFNSFISLPWHVTTNEFNELAKRHLVDGGIYAVNFVSALEGENSYFFKSMLKTFALSFPNFYVFSYGRKTEPQNIVLIGLNSGQKISDSEFSNRLLALNNGKDFLAKYRNEIKIDESAIVLRDDFAPVEKLMMPLANNYFPGYSLFYYSFIKD